MKPKFFCGIAVLVIVAVAAFNVNFNTQNKCLSAASLVNVEALAQGNESDSQQTWQVGEKTTVTTTSPGYSWDAGFNVWLINGKRTSSSPPSTETIKFKCCRPQGDLTSCSFENC